MRTFTLGSGGDRKFVMLEVDGTRVSVIEGKPDGRTKRKDKELKSETEAQTTIDRLIRELFARGFVEKPASGSRKIKTRKSARAAPNPAAEALGSGGIDVKNLFDDDVIAVEEEAAVLPRMGPPPTPAADAKPNKSGGKAKKKKKRKAAENGDALDKRVIGLAAAVGLALVGVVGFLVYEAALKPASIVGTWQGARLEYEIGKPIIHTQYRLVLDEKKHASMTLEQEYTSTGSYTVKGDRLTLNLTDEDGQESQVEYKIAVGRATLDLFEPSSGKKVVQMARLHEQPAVGGGAPPPPPGGPAAAPAGGEIDQAAEERLALVEFAPKDNAFRLRHPEGWKVETGARPDNTYSWGRFTQGSAKIQVYADVQGSLMAGPANPGQFEEGSAFAPVQNAHESYKRTVAEEYSDFKESDPVLFKGAPLGEGRISTFTASGGGLFGSKLKGYRVTLLSNDRRITLLCEAPEKEFSKLEPTFLAVCRSVGR